MDPGWEAAVVIAGVLAIVAAFYALDALQTLRRVREERKRAERDEAYDHTDELVSLVKERGHDVWPFTEPDWNWPPRNIKRR